MVKIAQQHYRPIITSFVLMAAKCELQQITKALFVHGYGFRFSGQPSIYMYAGNIVFCRSNSD